MMAKSILLLMVILAIAASSFAFDNKDTHPRITQQAIIKPGTGIDSYLINNLGFYAGINTKIPSESTNSILELLKKGSIDEDIPMCRASNHFHNPLIPWNQSYMTDAPWWINLYCSTWTRYSNITWATGYTSPSVGTISRDRQEMGWDNARNYFYSALTSTTNSDRESYFAKTFQSVGQVLHLLEDMAVPAHVRNDFKSHLTFNGINSVNPVNWVGNPFEYYVQINPDIVSAASADANIPVFVNPRVTDFWDTDQNGSIPGLAEFTNANYFSDETIPNNNPTPEHVFPSPQINSSNAYICIDYLPGSSKPTKYVSRKPCPVGTGDVDHFAALSLLNSESDTTNSNLQILKVWLDDNVHNTYAKEILPKAIGYSAGLLNYFFRGSIDLSLTDSGKYAITGPNSGFKEVRVRAQNSSPVGEDMPNGTIQLVVKYKTAQQDPFQSAPVATSDFQYITVPERNGVRAIPRDNPVELAFDLSTTPIPLWATDVYLQVVYRGQLGSEADAVAVGFKDISEPTPIDIVNSMDYVCINNNYLSAGSTEAINAVDSNHDGQADQDVFPDSVINDYLTFSLVQSPNYASSSNFATQFPEILPGNYGRVFILTDYSFGASNKVSLRHLDTRDRWLTSSFGTYLYTATGLKNQEEYVTELVDGQPVTYLARYYPLLSNTRGVNSWWPLSYRTSSYPSTSVCDDATLPPLRGPVDVQLP